MAAVLVLQTPFVAKDAGLSWRFEGTTSASSGHYSLAGKTVRGEVFWFAAKAGRFDAEALYKEDTQKTKDADAAKGFRHERLKGVLAGMPAIVSDQHYQWEDAAVTSKCLYAADGNRAWVVRLWWPSAEDKTALATVETFLKSVKRWPK